MLEIRRYVETQMRVEPTDTQRREAIRQGTIRVIDQLISSGTVVKIQSHGSRSGRYAWKLSG